MLMPWRSPASAVTPAEVPDWKSACVVHLWKFTRSAPVVVLPEARGAAVAMAAPGPATVPAVRAKAQTRARRAGGGRNVRALRIKASGVVGVAGALPLRECGRVLG